MKADLVIELEELLENFDKAFLIVLISNYMSSDELEEFVQFVSDETW